MASAGKGTRAAYALSKVHLLTAGVLFVISGVICLGFGLYKLVWLENLELGLATLGAGLALLFASLFGHFESFKIWGVEAKIKELNETVDKAEVALTQLRGLTDLTSEALMRLYCGLGRYSQPPPLLELDAIAENVRALLADAGRSDVEVRKMLTPWVHTMATAAHKNVVEELHKLLEPIRLTLLGIKDCPSHHEALTILPRIDAVAGYLSRETTKIENCSSEVIACHITAMVQNAPEITDEKRADLLRFANQAADEVKYLAANYKLRDKAFWGSLLYQ